MNEEPIILDAYSKPVKKSRADTSCPQCRAPYEKRVLSGGFGNNIVDICSNCGYKFDERTL